MACDLLGKFAPVYGELSESSPHLAEKLASPVEEFEFNQPACMIATEIGEKLRATRNGGQLIAIDYGEFGTTSNSLRVLQCTNDL